MDLDYSLRERKAYEVEKAKRTRAEGVSYRGLGYSQKAEQIGTHHPPTGLVSDGAFIGENLLELPVPRIWVQFTSFLKFIQKQRYARAEARSLLIYWALRELRIRGTLLAKGFKLSQPGVVYAKNKGEKIAKKRDFKLLE